MTNEEVLTAIRTDRRKERGKYTALIVLAVSIFAFTSLGLIRWDLKFVAIVAVAIFIHELGHLLAMKLYKYKNLKMMFLPFIGGVATGETDEQDAYKIAMISIFGPFVGLLSCFVSIIIYSLTDEQVFADYANLSLLLNAFNLLPIVPLDGGHFLNETLFSRFPKAELIFRVLAVFGLFWLAFVLKSVILGILAFLNLMGLSFSYKLSLAVSRLRKVEGIQGAELDADRIALIREELQDSAPILESNPKTLPVHISNVWVRVNKKFAGIGTTVFLVITYLVVSFGLIPFTCGFIYGATDTDFLPQEKEVTPLEKGAATPEVTD